MSIITYAGPRANPGSARSGVLGDEARHLWTRLGLTFRPDHGVLRVGFCATNAEEGTTSVATNFAICLGQQSLRTCLVETNFRSTPLAKHFKNPGHAGLSEVLSDALPLHEVLIEEVAPNVALVPAGSRPRDIYSAMSQGAIAHALKEAEENRDSVVIDCPPLGTSPEAGLILQCVDTVVLVVRAGKTRKREVARSIATLHDLGVAVSGAVLNRTTYDLPVAIDRML